MRAGGNAVDGAIAALFCNGLFNPHSMGIGGGLFMTIYIKETNEVVTLSARETAPAYTYPDMFHGNPIPARAGTRTEIVLQ